jgi:hypothetical protein
MPPVRRRAPWLGTPLLLTLSWALAGCASYPSNELEDARIPDMSGQSYRPIAYIDARFFQSEPDDPKPKEVPAGQSMVQAAVSAALKSGSPFYRYTFDPLAHDRVDAVVRLYFFNHSNFMTSVSGLLSGMTLGILPCAASDEFTLLASVEGAGPVQRSDDSITTWMGIWFVIVPGYSPQEAGIVAMEHLTRDGLRKLIETGQLKFTPPEAPRPRGASKPEPAGPAAPKTRPLQLQQTPQPAPQRQPGQPPAQPQFESAEPAQQPPEEELPPGAQVITPLPMPKR